MQYLFKNFPFAIILMISILIMLFKDYRKPIIIFCTIPLVFVGVVAVMLLTGKTFNFVAIVGTLGLIGMIIKNGIVLMDEITLQINQGSRTCDGIDRQFAKSSPSRDDGFADYDFGNDSIVAGCHVRFVGGFYHGWVAVRHVDNVAFYPDFVCIILSYKKDRQMKKEILVAISVAGVLFGLSVSLCRARKTKSGTMP